MAEVEIRTLKDIRMIAKLVESPDWVMPEGLERILPGMMAEIVSRKDESGQFAYKPTARIRASQVLIKMAEQLAAKNPPVQQHEHVFRGTVESTFEELQHAVAEGKITREELQALALAREVRQKLTAAAIAAAGDAGPAQP